MILVLTNIFKDNDPAEFVLEYNNVSFMSQNSLTKKSYCLLWPCHEVTAEVFHILGGNLRKLIRNHLLLTASHILAEHGKLWVSWTYFTKSKGMPAVISKSYVPSTQMAISCEVPDLAKTNTKISKSKSADMV